MAVAAANWIPFSSPNIRLTEIFATCARGCYNTFNQIIFIHSVLLLYYYEVCTTFSSTALSLLLQLEEQ